MDGLFFTTKGQLSPVGAGINGMSSTERRPDSKEPGGIGQEGGDDAHDVVRRVEARTTPVGLVTGGDRHAAGVQRLEVTSWGWRVIAVGG